VAACAEYRRCIGRNLLEWYDFAVYGFMAAMIGKAFFPGDRSPQFAAAIVCCVRRRFSTADWQRRDRLARRRKGRKPALVITI